MISIEDMAKIGCTTARGVRYWENEGLLGIVERSAGGQRRYTEAQLDRARIIAACKFGGWSLDDAKRMVLDYDREAYDALVHRLMSQVALAEQMAAALPSPADSKPVLEWDL